MTETYVTIEYNAKPTQSQPSGKPWGCLEGTPVYLDSQGNANLYLSSNGAKKICIVGKPIYNKVIDNANFAKTMLETSETDTDFYQQINGEFLLIELNDTHLRIINSRFASPIFWYVSHNGLFLGSTSYYQLCRRLKQLGLFELQPQVFYEFLNFKRLFGDKTYDKQSQYLKPASILTVGPNGTQISPYWNLEYNDNKNSLQDNAQHLMEAIQTAIQRKSSDNKNYGLFLSGGMDTRTVLAHFDTPPHCFTLTYSQNREYRVAKQLAEWKNSKHTWIQIQPGHYRKYLEDSIKLRGSMYMPDALFLGHSDLLHQHIDVLFAGYGFDYFFQGMYLPARTYKVFGKDLLYKRIDRIPPDMSNYFLNTISYRVKGQSVSPLLKADKENDMHDFLRNEIQQQIEIAKTITDNPLNIWEYLSLGDLSRHYTYGGQVNLMAQIDYRAIAYDNDLYNLYLSIPASQRFDARVFRKTLKMANPQFYHYMSANHGYPAGHSSTRRTLTNLKERGLQKIKLRKKSDFNVKVERTWPPFDQILREECADWVQALKTSDHLNALGFLDMDKLDNNISQWENQHIVGDQFYLMLLSIDRFLKSLEN